MKPSSRVIEILRGLQMENNSDIEIDFLRFHAVLQYLDEQAESQNPKALEEKRDCPCNCPDELTHYKKQIDILSDFLLANYQDEFGKVPAGESATEMAVRLLAKPQDEPKKTDCICNQFCKDWPIHPMYTWERCKCPCHQKETEPKEAAERDMDLDRCKNKECIGYKNGYADGAMIEKEQNALKNSSAIILQRPKGWRIGQTIWNFKEWLRLTHEVKDFFYMTDDEWNRRCNEYLTSIKSQE